MSNGWIKLNRKLLMSPCFQNRELLQLWIWLLLTANHEEGKAMIGNQVITVAPGQMVTGRNKISEATGLNSSKVERLLKVLKTEHQIEQQTFTKYRIISICNWSKYQTGEQQSEQQVNNKRTTSEHKQEGKEGKECKEENLTPPPQDRMIPSEAAKLLRDYSGTLIIGGGDWTVIQDICKAYAPEVIREAFQIAAASKPVKFLPYLLTVLKGTVNQASPYDDDNEFMRQVKAERVQNGA